MNITSKPATQPASKKRQNVPVLQNNAKNSKKAAASEPVNDSVNEPVNAPKKIGRPRIGAEVATVGVTILTTPEERETWRRLANGQPLSSWLRALVNANTK